jgi:hypothetical protein
MIGVWDESPDPIVEGGGLMARLFPWTARSAWWSANERTELGAPRQRAQTSQFDRIRSVGRLDSRLLPPIIR